MKKNFFKLSALAAVLVASATFASADTLQLGSYATGGANLGNVNTALSYTGFNGGSSSPTNGPAASTYFLDPNPPVWNAALPNSTWVGFAANAGPIGTSNPDFGYYTFTTTFTATASTLYNGSITLLADDTVQVYLNGVSIVPLGGLGGNAHCADNVPTCFVSDVVALNNLSLNLGANANKLTFVVQQMGKGPAGGTGDPSGFDFTANLTSSSPVPEPSTLMMLGTGLMGSAGMLFRRMRS